jgi:NADP-dependent 3-hydroxy acid dehydrogenase YdfG
MVGSLKTAEANAPNPEAAKEALMSEVEGKVVAITGASSGIGEATALLLAERGAKVVLGARRSDRLEALANRIAAAGGEAAYVRTDVKRRDDLSGLVKLACERYGKLDVLVSNAGIGPISLLDELRVTIVSPGFVATDFVESVTNPEVKSQLAASRDKFAIPPDAIARAIIFAIEQRADVDMNEIVIRPTAQV